MHTAECADADFRDWWPQGDPAAIALSSLPAAGATTNPIRLEGGADAPWAAVWGPFSGLRVAYSPRVSYPISSGAAFRYPRGENDLYLSVDPVSGGTVSIARFRTREAALAWGQSNNEILRVGVGALGPFPAATALTDADPNPTTTRVGSNNLIFDGTNWERWTSDSWGDNAPTPVPATPVVHAYDSVFSDRAAKQYRLRQPNATSPKSVVQSAVSIASTGVKATRTMAQDGYVRFAVVSPISGTPTNAVVALQLVRSATTYLLGCTGQLSVSLNVSYPVAFTSQNVHPWLGIPVLLGDVVQINVLTAAGAAATADFSLGIEEALYTI